MLESSAGYSRIWFHLLSSAISQSLDPAPIRLTDRDAVRGRSLVKRCQQTRIESLQLRTPIPRNAFLAACLELTEREPREHLLVGFGTRRASSTFVERVVRHIGSAGNVAFPHELQEEIAGWVQSGHRHEVLVFHNHPANFINAICDNEPWASTQDRSIAMRHACAPMMLLKRATNGGHIRFYLGENGYVREFVAPDVLTLLESINPR